MNGYSEFRFNFSGELQAPLDDRQRLEDDRLLGRFREEGNLIRTELAAYLVDEIQDELGIELAVRVDIMFTRGSVLFGGFVILEALAAISGTMDFVDKMIKLIRAGLRWVLGRRGGAPMHVRANVFPMFPVASPAGAGSSSADGLLFNLRTILLAITLLNAVIFVGGSVYTGVSVVSIQEKYEKAQKEIDTVRQDYEKYRAGLQDRLGDIEGQLRATGKEVDDTRFHNKQVSEDVAAMDVQAQQLKMSIASLRSRGTGWVSFKLAYTQANWVLKLLLILVPAQAVIFLIALSVVIRLAVKH